MNKNFTSLKIIIQSLMMIFLLLILIFAVLEIYELVSGMRNWAANLTLTWGVFLSGLLLIGFIVFFIVVINVWFPNWAEILNQPIMRFRDRMSWFNWLLVILFSLLPMKIFLYTSLGMKLSGIFLRLTIFIICVILMAFFASNRKKQLVELKSLLVCLLILGSVFVLGNSFTSVVNHPLSLTWSEGNRIWDYSIVFGRDLYNYPQNQPIEAYIDRARQTLWGIPFLLPNVSILAVRLWSAILFSIPYVILGWTTFRFQPGGKRQWFWLGLWVFLFLNQGPIYTPLILSGIMVAGARRKSMWAALPLIFLAGYYAQSSRINWMFAVGIWAFMIALGDFSPTGKGKIKRKDWTKIAAYTLVGFLGGFGIFIGFLRLYDYFTTTVSSSMEIVPIEASESVPPYINSDDSLEIISEINQNTMLSDQPLIWERLLPNPTYGLGIILGLIIAVGPVLILLLMLIRNNVWQLNLWQKIGILGGLSSLMFLGVLISTKIGGGGDLHNLDMFLVGVIFVSALAWQSGGYRILRDIHIQPTSLKISLILAIAVPAFVPWISAKPLELPPQDKTSWTLELLKAETGRVRSQGGEILFMDQRQLLTFGYLGDIPLIPEYEKKLVMDRAMSGDQEYFDQFYEDIRQQRFSLIISDPQRIRYSDENEGWGVENDTWVQWVTKPLLCYYEPVYTVKKTGVWLLTPVQTPEECVYP